MNEHQNHPSSQPASQTGDQKTHSAETLRAPVTGGAARLAGKAIEGIGKFLTVAGILGLFVTREFIVILLAVAVIAIGGGLVALGKKLRQEKAEDLLARDPRPPVFLLRSFGRDDVGHQEYNRLRDTAGDRFGFGEFLVLKTVDRVLKEQIAFEELLAPTFNDLGPFIAIGRPDEKLPPAGAARFYASDETWKEKVRELIDRSVLVVIVLDLTPGLMWEVSHLNDRDVRAKTLLLTVDFPEKIEKEKVFEAWERMIREEAGVEVKIDASVVGIYFDPDGNPVRLTSEKKRIEDRLEELKNFVAARKAPQSISASVQPGAI